MAQKAEPITGRDSIAEGRTRWMQKYGAQGGAAMETASNLVRVHEILVNRMDEELAQCDLTFGEYDVLAVIGEFQSDPLPLGKIGPKARQFFNHQTSVTNVVSRLIERGLVRTKHDPVDGRVTLVALTPTGARRLRKANRAMTDVQFGLGDLDDAERAQLTALLVKLRAAHGDLR
jgi:DNA-binding MarR family transcriptional regulator